MAAVPLCSPRLLTGAQFTLSQITVDFVYKQLKALNSKESSGLPDILYGLWKDGAEVLPRPLTLLMNRTINEGTLPADWKHAIVTPFKLVRNQIHRTYLSTSSFLQNTWTVSPPYGLQLFTGTQTSFSSPLRLSPTPRYIHMPHTRDKHSAGKHWRRTICVIFLDVSKAFGTLDHSIMLSSCINAVQWFRSYLTSCLTSLYLSGSPRVAYLALYYLSSTKITYPWQLKVVAPSFMLTIHLWILQASQSVKFKLS